MMTVFYTSDTHFGHLAVLRKDFVARPFRNVEDMNVALVNRWNARVQRGDTVWHLGDFAFEGLAPRAIANLLCQLNGEKHLIVGNHDHQSTIMGPWASVQGAKDVTTRKGMVFRLSHYPPTRNREGEIYLHGHLHKTSAQRMPVFDVGVDANHFYPWAEHELERAVEGWRRGHDAFKALMEGRAQ